MTTVGLAHVGLIAPGLAGWQASRSILAGTVRYEEATLPALKPTLLPASERRRATALVKLALAAAEDTGLPRGMAVASVFASSGGDLDIVDRICRALGEPDRPVSPTHFHNSVHNAPAGYWAIATGCPGASQSIAGYDGSFAVGLVEAAALTATEALPVLFVAYDQVPPAPFSDQRAIAQPFAVAMLLTPETASAADRLVRLTLAFTDAGRHEGDEPPALTDPRLEALRQTNPAARSLPLLQAIARCDRLTLVLPCLPRRRLSIQVEP